MIEVAEAISGFLPNAQVAPVSSTEEAVFVLTTSELKAVISAAVTEALKPALERVSDLEADISALKAEIVDVRASSESEIERVCEDIAFDRRRLCQLEQSMIPTPAPLGDKTAARTEKLKEFLKARGGGATFQEVERLLNIRPNQMTALVSQLDKRRFEVFARSGDKRQRIIRLKAQIIQ